MVKWLLGIVAVVVLLIAFLFSAYIWLAMAGGLQRMVDDNLTLLKRDLILHDRALNFEYEHYGVEVKGFLQPALTLESPRLTVRQGGTEYRLTAPELSFMGAFSQLSEVVLESPERLQLTVKKEGQAPRVMFLTLPSNLEVSLLTDGAESHMWERYQLPKAIAGKITLEGSDKGIKYALPKTGRELLNPPYSPHLIPILQKISALEAGS